VLLWAIILPVNMTSIFLLKSHEAGAWTFFESMIWLIWTTFIGATLLASVANYLLGFRIDQLGLVVAVLSAYAFSMMGGMMGKRWFVGATLFALAALAVGAFPNWQFIILGLTWGIVQFVAGATLHAQRKRRLATGAAARLV
jgi:hypothetical protein